MCCGCAVPDFTTSALELGLGGVFEGEWIQVYVWLSSFPVHLKLLQCC